MTAELAGISETAVPAASAPVATTTAATARRVDIEALRVVAAAMVVTIHLTSLLHTGDHTLGWWLSMIGNMASRACVPVFFAVSGWAMLSRPIHTDEVGWLLKRLQRLVIPLLVWDAIYTGVTWVLAQHYGWEIGTPGHLRWWLAQEATVSLVGPGTSAQLWFMYFLVPTTIAIWMLKVAPLALSDRPTRNAFYLAAVALIVPFGLPGSFFDGISWAQFGWVLGVAVAGYVMLASDPLNRWISAALFVGATIGLVIADIQVGYDRWTMAYPGPLVLLQSVGLIGLVRSIRFPASWQRPIVTLGKLTFGVFMVHLVFLQAFGITIYETTALPDFVMLVGSYVAAVVLSFAAVALWHRSRRLEMLLG